MTYNEIRENLLPETNSIFKPLEVLGITDSVMCLINMLVTSYEFDKGKPKSFKVKLPMRAKLLKSEMNMISDKLKITSPNSFNFTEANYFKLRDVKDFDSFVNLNQILLFKIIYMLNDFNSIGEELIEAFKFDIRLKNESNSSYPINYGYSEFEDNQWNNYKVRVDNKLIEKLNLFGNDYRIKGNSFYNQKDYDVEEFFDNLTTEKTPALKVYDGNYLKRFSNFNFKNFKTNGFNINYQSDLVNYWLSESTDRFINVTGVAGAGKSTSMKQFITSLDDEYNVDILSFTNLAVQGMRVKLKDLVEDFDNIHISTIDSRYYNNKKPITCNDLDNILIVDEAGFNSNDTFRKLKYLINKFDYEKIIFLGDPNQLLPTSKGDIYRNIQRSNDIHMGHTWRFKGQLLDFAEEVLHNEDASVEYAPKTDLDFMFNNFSEIEETQYLTHTNERKSITNQTILDKMHSKPRVKYVYKLVETENDTNPIKLYVKGQLHTVESDVPLEFEPVDNDSIFLTDGQTLTNNNGFINYERLELAYSMTINKSQGSEWNNVICDFPRSKRKDKSISRNLFYVAVTRSKSNLYFINYNKRYYDLSDTVLKTAYDF